MRSIEYLVQLYPEKTGRELLEIQAKEKKEDQKAYERRFKKQLEFISDINTNGGEDQRFYYNVTDARIEHDTIFATVESIVVFLGDGRSVVSAGDVSIKKEKKEWAELNKYGLESYQRTTKKDYDEVLEHLLNLAKYWEEIKKV